MAKQILSPEQREQRQRKRDQQEHDEERFRFGSQGPASEVRKIDVASVDTAALLAQPGACFAKFGRSISLNHPGVIPVTDYSDLLAHKPYRERGSIMRKLFIFVAVVFALVSIGAGTVVTTALTSDGALAQAIR
jgi:hypothetical protein